ncbi:hypothetical protein OG875_13875 [Streptomyces sp. NBC_01498]|uniref:hypothetical protein n=1 Tax=Streptomyces sp. NBC_01498 TaxID=2975870 RepID=UPI002E7BCA5A|nr:hypothetical protein [Streptomyces sp. NBC_01498]WTL25589.1 hypothetical protein OG875_13875 [Streptomyces sp. NBC_01498]
MDIRITGATAPALGDVRGLGRGDTLWLEAGARDRRDWGRYVDAVAQAVHRGADARWARG